MATTAPRTTPVEEAAPPPRLAIPGPAPVSMEEALIAYRLRLEVEGKSDRLIDQAVSAIRRASVQHGWKHPRDITMRDLTAHLAHMTNRGKDPKTRNMFVYYLRMFCTACKVMGAIAENPITDDAPHARATKKDARVVPTQDEVRRLIRAARKDVRKKDRWLVYLTAATANLRWKTLKLLQWEHVHETDKLPFIKMPASILKARDPRVIFLTRELADALAEHRKTSIGRGIRERMVERKKHVGAWVFEAVPKWDGWCRDCEAAEIERIGEGGASFSFHSLRHFASNLARLRGLTDDERAFQNTHATTQMTAEIYTNSSWIELGRKVLSMPGLLTGTEGGDPDGVSKSRATRLTNRGQMTDDTSGNDEQPPEQFAHHDAAGPAGARRCQTRSRGNGRDAVCMETGRLDVEVEKKRTPRGDRFESCRPD